MKFNISSFKFQNGTIMTLILLFIALGEWGYKTRTYIICKNVL